MGNVHTLGEKLNRLVGLTKVTERSAQVSKCDTFPSPVPKLTVNEETFGVELDRLVVLTKVIERTAQVD